MVILFPGFLLVNKCKYTYNLGFYIFWPRLVLFDIANEYEFFYFAYFNDNQLSTISIIQIYKEIQTHTHAHRHLYILHIYLMIQ